MTRSPERYVAGIDEWLKWAGRSTPTAKTERSNRVEFRRIAEARTMIEQARLLTLKAAWMMDNHGNKPGRMEIAMIEVAAPNIACRIIDWAIHAFGGAGVTGDYGLAYAYAIARVLQLADEPDEVHATRSPASNCANTRAPRASVAVRPRCCPTPHLASAVDRVDRVAALTAKQDPRSAQPR